MDCGRSRDYLQDKEKSGQLLKWVDSAIFSREFSEDDYERAEYKGAGPPFVISADAVGITAAGESEVLEIRIIGTNFEKPDGVYVALSPTSGIVIARSNLDEMLAAKLPTTQVLRSPSHPNRLGSYCGGYRTD
jgi:hypothetical protein